MEQIQSLLNPVKDEDNRVKLLTNNLAKDHAILKETSTEDDYEDSMEAKAAKAQLEN